MAEAKLTTMTDLGEIKSIDFVNKFSKISTTYFVFWALHVAKN